MVTVYDPIKVNQLCEQATRDMNWRRIPLDIESVKRTLSPKYAKPILELVSGGNYISPSWFYDQGPTGHWSCAQSALQYLKAAHLPKHTIFEYSLQIPMVAATCAGDEELLSVLSKPKPLRWYEMSQRLECPPDDVKVRFYRWLHQGVGVNLKKAFPVLAAHRDRIATSLTVTTDLLKRPLQNPSYINFLFGTCTDMLRCIVAECQEQGIPLYGVLQGDSVIAHRGDIEAVSEIFQRVGKIYNVTQFVGATSPSNPIVLSHALRR